MCGRFALTATTKDIEKLVPKLKVNTVITPGINIAPTQSVSIIRKYDDSYVLDSAHWGLIPSWAKDPSIGNKLFNARAETIDEKPSFRSAFKSRRCLIPASWFYEWKSIEGSKRKQAYKIHLADNTPIFFAGLWEIWKDENSFPKMSATIITTEPNSLIESIHNRMPAIILDDYQNIWLDEKSDAQLLKDILAPISSNNMTFEKIDSNYFNIQRNDDLWSN